MQLPLRLTGIVGGPPTDYNDMYYRLKEKPGVLLEVDAKARWQLRGGLNAGVWGRAGWLQVVGPSSGRFHETLGGATIDDSARATGSLRRSLPAGGFWASLSF